MKHLLLLASVLIAMPAWARTLTPAEALQRAQGEGPAKVAATQGHSRLVKTGFTAKNQPAYYIFDNADNKGYMILAADDVAVPVLGYSATGTINADNMPENLKGWLENYAAEIAWAAEREAEGKLIVNDLTKETTSKRDTWATIAPLCQTKWNQSEPYDLYTPEITYNGQTIKAATGCVATAMAQVMKYFNYPAKGKGSISYNWKKYDDFKNTGSSDPSTTVTLSMDFSSVTFAWDDMLNVYNGDYTSAQGDAVATLMKACGYSVQMGYGPESGAVTGEVANALKTYFGYDSNTAFYSRQFYDLDTWEEMLYNNLKDVGPVQYSGRNDYGGHSFVVDGYAGNGYYHLNWGWGGMSDGNFLITALDPDAQGIGGSLAGYNQNQGAILGAQPAGATIPVIKPFQLAITKAMTTSVSGQKLTISSFFGNNGGESPLVNLGLQFCKYADDAVVETASGTRIGNWPASINSGVYSISATIPSSLEAGIYKVYPVASTDGGANWKRAIAPVGSYNYVLLQKKDDGSYAVAPMPAASVSVESLELSTPVYYGMKFQAQANIVNDNDVEVLQNVTPAFLKQSDTGGYSLMAYCQTQAVDLRAGSSMDLALDLSVIRQSSSYVAGEELLFALLDLNSGDILSDLLPVTIQKAPTTITLQTTASGFTVRDADAVPINDVHIDYKVKCQTGYYANPLYVLIFNANLQGYNIDALTTPTCYITEGNWAEGSDVKVGSLSNVEVGTKYAAVLFYRSSTGLKQLSNAVYITVAPPSSINDIRAEGSDDSVKASMMGGILTVTASSDIRSIDVYDLSGARVASSSTSTADLSGASDGVYVVKVITATGDASLKLMK